MPSLYCDFRSFRGVCPKFGFVVHDISAGNLITISEKAAPHPHIPSRLIDKRVADKREAGLRSVWAQGTGGERVLDVSNAGRLGPNLRQLRQEKGLTLDRLAQASDLTRGYLSLVERGLKTPSITALLRIAETLGVNIAQLFDLNAAPAPANYTLHRRGEGVLPQPDGTFGLLPLAPGRSRKMMEPFLMMPATKPALSKDPRWAHGGEEMLYVVSGRIAVRLGDDELVMERGDCLYFPGEIKHEVRSLGRQKAEVLVVIALPSGQDMPSRQEKR